MADNPSSNDTIATATALGVLAIENDGSYPATNLNFVHHDSVDPPFTGGDSIDYVKFEPHRLSKVTVDLTSFDVPGDGYAHFIVSQVGSDGPPDSYTFFITGKSLSAENEERLAETIEIAKGVMGDTVVVDGSRAGSAFNRAIYNVSDPDDPSDSIVLMIEGSAYDMSSEQSRSVDYTLNIAAKSGIGEEPSDPDEPGQPTDPEEPTTGEVIKGSRSNDSEAGTSGDDKIALRGGNDTGRGGKGNDRLFGQSGNDKLYGGQGKDRVDGGLGNDTLFGNDGGDRLFGSKGHDKLYGQRGFDKLFGGGGDDRLNGGAGNDRIFGHGGDDTGRGGKGNDELYGNGGSDRLLGGDGRDLVEGGAGGDKLYGNGGGDVVVGNGGHDKLFGQRGADTLVGGNGDDRLVGGAGKDVLLGGTGRDVLVGGAGADRFEFATIDDSPAFSSDVILDFNPEEGDKIDLRPIDPHPIHFGDDEFDFIGQSNFSGWPAELRFERENGDTFVYGDVHGDGIADFTIKLDGSHDLKESDFIL